MFKILKKYFYLFKDVKLNGLVSKENLNKNHLSNMLKYRKSSVFKIFAQKKQSKIYSMIAFKSSILQFLLKLWPFYAFE